MFYTNKEGDAFNLNNVFAFSKRQDLSNTKVYVEVTLVSYESSSFILEIFNDTDTANSFINWLINILSNKSLKDIIEYRSYSDFMKLQDSKK